MDPRDLKQASKLINNQLASRGLLRGGKTVAFHRPAEEDAARIINVVHELISRRDVEEQERESLAETLRALRAGEARMADTIESLKAKNADLARRNGLLESAARSFDHTLRTSEAQQRALRDEATRIKTVLGQVRTHCANDIRKRDVQITKLKERLSDTRPRGQRAPTANCTIINPSNLGASTSAASTREEGGETAEAEAAASVVQETADFLTTLSQNLADENDNLIALVRTTLSTLKAIQGLPDDDHFDQGDEERPVVALPADFDKFTTDLDQVLFSLKEVINQPNYVPLEALAEKEQEITRLTAKNEMLEAEWKKAIDLVDEWNRTLSRGFTHGVGGEQREKALAQSEDILKNSPKKVSPRRSVMEVFKERGVAEEEEEEEEEMNEGLRAVLSMVQEEDEEDEEEQPLESVAEEATEEVQAPEEEVQVEAEKEMDGEPSGEVGEEEEQEPEPAVEEIEQEEQLSHEQQEADQAEDQQEDLEPASQTNELLEEATQEVVIVQSPAAKSPGKRPKRKSRSTPTPPTLTPEPQQTPVSKRKSSNAKDTPFRQLFEDREIATKSPSMAPKPNTRRRGSTLTALDEPEEVAEGRRRSRRGGATAPEEDIPPVPAVSKAPAKAKAPALSMAPVLSKTPALSKTPSRKSPRKKHTLPTPEIDASARQLVQEELQATPARTLELKKSTTTTTTRRTRNASLAAGPEEPQASTDLHQSRSRRRKFTRRTANDEVGETTEVSALESIMADEDSAPPKLKLRPRSTRGGRKAPEPEPEPEPEDLDMLLTRAVRDESEAPQPQPEPTQPRTLRGRTRGEKADDGAAGDSGLLEDTFVGVARRRSTRRGGDTAPAEPTHHEEAAAAVALTRSREEKGEKEEEEEEGREGGGVKRRRSLRNRDKDFQDRPAAAAAEGRKRKSMAEREEEGGGGRGVRMSPRKRVARRDL